MKNLLFFIGLIICYFSAKAQSQIGFLVQPQLNLNAIQTKNDLGYMMGIQYIYSPKNKNNNFNVGILIGQQDGLYFCDSIKPISGAEGKLCIINQRRKASYLTIPIWTSFQITENYNFIGGIGFQYNHLLKKEPNWRKNYTDNFVNFLVKLGYFFKISNRLTVNISADYQHSINDIRSDDFREHYNIIGTSFSLTHQLN